MSTSIFPSITLSSWCRVKPMRMIRYAILREIVECDFFAAVAGLDLGRAFLGESRPAALHFDLHRAGTATRIPFRVLDLRLLVLATDDRVVGMW